MNTAVGIMLVVAIILLVIAYLQGDDLHIRGLKTAANMFLRIIPILVIAFVIAGVIQVLIPKEFVIKWLGKEAGWKGILFGTLAGGLTPGGPFVSFPIVASIYKAGASIGTVVAFVTAWSLVAVGRLPWEISLISPKFTMIRLACTFFFPPVAGMLAQLLFSKIA